MLSTERVDAIDWLEEGLVDPQTHSQPLHGKLGDGMPCIRAIDVITHHE